MQGSAKIEKTHQILLIEDDPIFARLVQAYLSDVELLTCTITHVSHLNDGRAQLRNKSNNYAAVLLDLSLPDSQGFETLETLLYEFPKLNVIVMTGQTDKSLGLESVKAGAQDFLVKGEFNENGLAKSLRFSIERSSILNRLEETQRMARIGHWECSPSEHYFSGSEELYRIFKRPFHQKLTCQDILNTEGPFSVFITLQQQTTLQKKAQIDTWVEPENGPPRFVSMICTAALLSNGQISYNGIVQDITERKQAQELKKERDVAEQAAKVREQFIASVSHEMRTPMNAIQGMGNLLSETPLNTEQFEYVDAIKRSSGLLLGIISDILEMSTIQNDQVIIEQKPFCLRELLQGLRSVLKYKAREKQLDFDLEISSDVPDGLVGDPLRLNQVMYNLVGNAIKFTDEGGISLKVVNLEEQEDRVRLLFEVNDTGVGIPKDQQEKIFESFVRVPVQDRIYEGTGLGL
ncbi:MAG: response regulator, partial [Phaeodactylibacter sp.]|nr:response regulator [Phaeodactylibacter sp.]